MKVHIQIWMDDGRLITPVPSVVEDENIQAVSEQYNRLFSFEGYSAFMLPDGSMDAINPYKVQRVNMKLEDDDATEEAQANEGLAHRDGGEGGGEDSGVHGTVRFGDLSG